MRSTLERKCALLQGMLLQTLSCLGSSAGVFLCYTLLFVVRTQPWWAPQYFIPILGMMLGNSISGVSVGLSALLEDFSVGKCRCVQPCPFILLSHLRTGSLSMSSEENLWIASTQCLPAAGPCSNCQTAHRMHTYSTLIWSCLWFASRYVQVLPGVDILCNAGGQARTG